MSYIIIILEEVETNKGFKLAWKVKDYTPNGTVSRTNFNTKDWDFINKRLQMLAEVMYD